MLWFRLENYRYSFLYEVILKDYVDICKLMLDYGSDVNERIESYVMLVMLVCGIEGLKNRR